MASTPLQGKVALITGGSRGIGRASVLHLAGLGASVVINYSSDAAPAEELVAQIGSDRAIAVRANAGDVQEIEKLVQTAVDRFGKIDILIPNAGMLPMLDLESTTEEDFDEAFGLNVKGPYFLCQKAVPHMPEGSHVVLLSTTQCANTSVQPAYLLYCATKGAIEQMTRLLSKDLARRGIFVNAVAPGPTGTDLFFSGKSEHQIKAISGISPFQRIGKPEEVAETVGWLANSQWVSGQVLRVNGGAA